jgi:hypothetical protein
LVDESEAAIERVGRLPGNHGTQSVGKGFDESMDDRQRKGLRLRDGGKIAFVTANRMLALR